MGKTGTKEWSTVSKNIFHGCKHNCKYCFARANALRFKQIEKPEQWTDMKLNERNLNEKPRFYKGITSRIMMPTTHDIFPEHIDMTVKYLKGWLNAGNSILIVSKPHFECIKRLCDELGDYKSQITFRFTIGSLNNDVLKFWEPNAPDFDERLKSLKYAYEKGFETSVSCEPYLDNSIEELVKTLIPFINDTIWIGKMNRIANRVDTSKWTMDDYRYLNYVKEAQTDEFVWNLYGKLKDNPKVKWKDSIKQVVGLPEEEIG